MIDITTPTKKAVSTGYGNVEDANTDAGATPTNGMSRLSVDIEVGL